MTGGFISISTDSTLAIILRIINFCLDIKVGDARGVIVIVVGNGHGDTSSNPGPDWLHFT